MLIPNADSSTTCCCMQRLVEEDSSILGSSKNNSKVLYVLIYRVVIILYQQQSSLSLILSWTKGRAAFKKDYMISRPSNKETRDLSPSAPLFHKSFRPVIMGECLTFAEHMHFSSALTVLRAGWWGHLAAPAAGPAAWKSSFEESHDKALPASCMQVKHGMEYKNPPTPRARSGTKFSWGIQ